MKTLFCILISILVFSSSFCQSNEKAIIVGDKLPSFSLSDQNDSIVHIDSLVGKQILVIYFYPKDDSPGCTKQACYFRDMYEVFKDANAKVIGISGQSVESHKKFEEKYKLNFTLLSDKGNKVSKLFGVPGKVLPGRVTYVIDKQGIVVYIFNSQANVTQHVDEALRIIKSLK